MPFQFCFDCFNWEWNQFFTAFFFWLWNIWVLLLGVLDSWSGNGDVCSWLMVISKVHKQSHVCGKVKSCVRKNFLNMDVHFREWLLLTAVALVCSAEGWRHWGLMKQFNTLDSSLENNLAASGESDRKAISSNKVSALQL